MKNLSSLILCFAVCMLILVAGCTQSTPAPAATPVPTKNAPVPSGDTVKTAATSLGTILTDSQGKSLYFFADDIPSSGISTCSGKCLSFWPVFYSASPVVSAPLAASDFSVITRADGTSQTTYKGWPLYYFSKDASAGDLKGENIQGNWSVAKPDYTVMYAHQPGVGTYLTDATGRTLYYFTRDAADATACTDSCATTWPPFSSGSLVAPSLLKSADFSGGKRPDGMMQSFYKDRPLYYFSKDSKPGDVKGQGIINSWYVADITGFVPATPTTVPTALPTAIPTTIPTFDYSSSSSGGGGY